VSVPLQKTIGLRLLRYVFGCYFAVTVIITTVQLISEYRHVKKNIFYELASLGETLGDSLALSVWNYDVDQLESTLQGINKISMVSGTKVTDAAGKIFAHNGNTDDTKEILSTEQQEGEFGDGIIHQIRYKDHSSQKTVFSYKFPIYFANGENAPQELIGYCYIYADRTSIISRVEYGFFLIIVNSIVKTIALWFIFLYFTKRIIAKPLGLLTQATREIDPNEPDTFRKKDTLEKIFYSGHHDELHLLADSFVKMRNSVIEKIDVIEQQNLTLEERVKERTATIEEVNRELKYLSLHDPLTGLPNRMLFHDRLDHLLNIAKRDNQPFAIASIDLRKFKDINDTFGHQAGDIVLKELSQRMKDTIRSVDTIARMGGDEFAILLPGTGKDNISALGEKIIACGYKPVIFEHEHLLAGINIGFSMYPDHGEDGDTLFKNADMAMYEAKKSKHGLSIFSTSVNRKLRLIDTITQDLPKMIENGQLFLHYQPIVCCNTHRLTGVEALARWQHPTEGLIAPSDFIPIAERSSIIKGITEWVIEQALSDITTLPSSTPPLNVAINLSGRLISDPTLSQRLEQQLKCHNIAPERMTLELTETSAMQHPKQTLAMLQQLKALGVRLSIDDMGTGYSSLSHLGQLPVDELKIDHRFLCGTDKSSQAQNQIVVEAIIGLAQRLQLEVVAEGVEQASTLKTIESLHCNYLQGFYFSKPLPLDELILWINDFNA